MRNIFKRLSKYPYNPSNNPEENQITEMLAYVLSADEHVKEAFLRYAADALSRASGLRKAQVETHVVKIIDTTALRVADEADDDGVRDITGIPDMAITGDNFTVLFENKIGADIGLDETYEMDQITKYLKILAGEPSAGNIRRLILIGFDDRIDANKISAAAAENADLYKMFNFLSWHDLADFFFDYEKNKPLEEPARTLLSQFNEHLYEEMGMGTFRGLPEFNPENPFTKEKAKTALGALTEKLNGLLTKKELGFDFQGVDKKNVRAGETGAWIPLTVAGCVKHTLEPHITLGLSENDVGVYLILPNSSKAEYKKNFAALIREKWEFADIINGVRQNVPELWFTLHQCHAYTGQELIIDGTAAFKIDLIPGIEPRWERSCFKQTDVWWALLENFEKMRKEVNVEIAFAVRYYTKMSGERKNRDRFKPYEVEPYEKDFAQELFRSIKALMPLFKAVYEG